MVSVVIGNGGNGGNRGNCGNCGNLAPEMALHDQSAYKV